MVAVPEAFRPAVEACRRHIVGIAAFSAVLNLLLIAPTLYMLQIYERVIPTQSHVTLLFLTCAIFFALVMVALLEQVRSKLLVRGGVALDQIVAPVALRSSFEPSRSTESRQAMRDLDLVRQVISGPAFVAFCDLPWTPIYVLACFLVHPLIGVVALFGLIILPFLLWRHEKATGSSLAEAQAAAARSYTAQDQILSDRDAVRSLGMAPALVRRQLRLRSEMLALQTRAGFASSRYTALSKFVRLLIQSLALGVGALLAIGGHVSAGAVFAAAFLVARALAPVEQIIGAWKGLTQARTSYSNLTTLLERIEAEQPRTNLPPPTGRLQVEDVVLNRPSGGEPILNGVSLTLARGETLGIIGPSGAGKSTLLRLIAGTILPDAGHIRFDGADRLDWRPETLSRHVGVLPHDGALLAGTVKENISRFDSELSDDPDAVDAAVIQAAQQAGAHEFILRLDSAYDHQLAPRGANLSSGQAQRIALARALYGGPAYLLLDEPNAHLDSEGDANLLTTMQRLKQAGATILVVTHRLGLLPVVDKLLVLRDGRVEMFGPRDEILPKVTRSNVRSVDAQQAKR